MALSVVIRQPEADGPELSLSLDAPRVVVGRGKGCDVILPDPSVSARHASIRLQGGRNLIVDEGSTNGTLVGSVKLPPQTPRAVTDGELVRIGRVWLELRFGTGHAGEGAAPRRAQALAKDLLTRQLRSEGEEIEPYLEVTDGPDRGAKLVLTDHDRDYVIGRSRDSDLVLRDELASRRHVAVSRDGAGWRVRDHGSKRGSELDGEPLDREGAIWGDGKTLIVGDSILVLRDPLLEAYQEALDAPDIKMRTSELAEPPPGVRSKEQDEEAEEEPLAVVEAPDEAAFEFPPTPTDIVEVVDALSEPASRGAGFVDAMVALVAMGLLGLSLAGLWWVLG